MGYKKVFFPNLDGLRFFAFFAVFLAHSFYSKFNYIIEQSLYQRFREAGHLGMFGVNFFFVLSGFLISYLLFVEKQNFGKISISNFYVRRILRIWPLYYLIILVGFVVIPQFQNTIGNLNYREVANLPSFLFFYNNFSSILPTSAVLGVLWSIAVEEQFYLFWPLIIRVIPINKMIPFCLFLIAISAGLRTLWIGYGYQNTFSCISDFAVGALLAYYTYTNPMWLNKLKQMKKQWIVLIYLIGISLFFFRSNWANIDWIYNNERLLFSLFFAFVIMEQNTFQNSIYKCGSSQVLSALGKFTYGLYMYHFVAIYIVALILDQLHFNTELYQVLFIEPVLSLLLSVFMAYFSYYLVEARLLKLKTRFSNIISGN